MVFRHRARARHRGQGKCDQRAKSATRRLTHLKGASPPRDSHSPPRDSHSLPRDSHSPFSRGDWAFCWGDSALFQKATRPDTRATRRTGGNSRNRVRARGGNSLGRVDPRGGGDSLAPLGPSRLARRPRRGRLAPATCARRGRLAPAPLPRAPPLPPRSLPSGCKYVLTQRVHSHLRVLYSLVFTVIQYQVLFSQRCKHVLTQRVHSGLPVFTSRIIACYRHLLVGIRLLVFTRYTTSTLRSTAMLGPSHPDTGISISVTRKLLASVLCSFPLFRTIPNLLE